MKNLIILFFLLSACISCSEKEDRADILDVNQALLNQKHFYYTVEYSVSKFNAKSVRTLYGTVALNRSMQSGISTAYFGLRPNQKPHYLNSLYLNTEWIYNLESAKYTLDDSDVITDSLHSPILLNPNVILDFQENSAKVSNQKIHNNMIKWTFDLADKPDQLTFLWDSVEEQIKEIEYIYNINSEHSYSRKWNFDYVAKTEFLELTEDIKHKNLSNNQSVL